MTFEEFTKKGIEDAILYDFKLEQKPELEKEENPIKRILKSWQDLSKFKVENEATQLAKEIYKKLWNINDADLEHLDKDVMNSFWFTLKFSMQIEYPEVFRPDGDLKNGPLSKPEKGKEQPVKIKFPPFKLNILLDDVYIDYFKREFKGEEKLTVKDENDKPLSWFEFLLENSIKFP